MKKFNKVLAVFLALLMAFAALPMTGIVAFAEDAVATAAESYSIKYNANGGTGTMANTTHNAGEPKELRANAFKRTGYVFLGWATTKSATAPEFADKEVVVDLAADGVTLVTLYAVWSPISYSVEFRPNGGEGTMANQTFKYGETQALSANTFTRDGYTFLGWAKSGTATKATYTDGKEVKNLATAEGAVVVLYAIWQKNPVYVTEIFVVTPPTKTEYVVGDAFDATGLAIGVNYTDNTTQTVTTGFALSAPDMTTAGEKTVTVSYEGFSVTFTINVAEKPAEPEYNYTFTLEAPTSVNVGETASIAAKLEGVYPAGVTVDWSADNDNFVPTGLENNVLTAVASKAGTTVVTATLLDAEGNELASASATITVVEEIVEPEEPEDPVDPEDPADPADPSDPTGGLDIMSLIMTLINLVMSYLQPIIDMVMGLIGA